MSFQVSAVPTKPQNVISDIIESSSADYHPITWDDLFLSCASSVETDEHTKKQAQELKEEIRRMIMDGNDDKPSQKLHLIDAVQRLGASYHFKNEIDDALQKLHKNHHDNVDDNQCDLYTVAVQFRLLRQHGYYVSCGVFNMLKDKKGKFKKSLVNDVQGMLGVYEATHLRIHGEDVLEDALAFTTYHLEAQLECHLNPNLAAQVNHALKQPLHKGIPRLEARHFISIYQEDPSHNKELLTFAKLDFNLLQKVHQKELNEFTRWWKDLDFENKLPFARDRVVECYFWILSVYYEPEYSLARKIVTKVITMISTIGDLYGIYGEIRDLELFTEATERWNLDALDLLPDYMQVCYAALLDVYVEIEEEMSCQGKSYRVYAKEAMQSLIKGYFQEAKWFNQQCTPSMEEYMSVALVTTAYSMLATTSFIGMGDVVTKDAYEWILKEPKIVKASEIICRLMDDMASNKFEQKGGDGASSIKCYMKQHGGTEQEVIKEFGKQVSHSWKDINEECLQPTNVPMALLTRILNFTRLIDVFYKDDCYSTNAEIFLEGFVTFLLVDSVSI